MVRIMCALALATLPLSIGSARAAELRDPLAGKRYVKSSLPGKRGLQWGNQHGKGYTEVSRNREGQITEVFKRFTRSSGTVEVQKNTPFGVETKKTVPQRGGGVITDKTQTRDGNTTWQTFIQTEDGLTLMQSSGWPKNSKALYAVPGNTLIGTAAVSAALAQTAGAAPGEHFRPFSLFLRGSNQLIDVKPATANDPARRNTADAQTLEAVIQANKPSSVILGALHMDFHPEPRSDLGGIDIYTP